MSPFRAGLIAIVVIAVGTFFAFSKAVPFLSHYEVSAVVHSANNVKERQPVRIAGVEVGQVVEVEHPEPGKERAVIRMRIEDEGRPVHEDATVKIRPRLFLEGNWLIDLEPGTPAEKEIPDGGTIPIQQTARPVQLGQVLTALQSNTRKNLQTLLARVLRRASSPRAPTASAAPSPTGSRRTGTPPWCRRRPSACASTTSPSTSTAPAAWPGGWTATRSS